MEDRQGRLGRLVIADRRMLRAIVAALTAGIVLAVGACGDDASSDREQITETTDRAFEYLRTSDPSLCDVITPSFAATLGAPRELSTDECKEELSGERGLAPIEFGADDVTVTDVSVEGDTATATVEAPGLTETFDYVNEDGTWKIDGATDRGR